MQRYEFKVVPAPRRGEKSREARTTEDRFALALTGLMNQMGREGWDFIGAETLPCDERSGLMGTTTTEQNVLVFRRPLAVEGAQTVAAPVAVARAADAPRLGPATDGPTGAAPALGPATGE